MDRSDKEIRIFSGTANRPLAERIAAYFGTPLGEVEIARFPDGELWVKYDTCLRSDDVFIIQPICGAPNEALMELLIMIDAARRASAARITAVIPYLGYARQDRKDQPRVPITAKLVANLITVAGASRVLTMDLHSQQIQGFFDIPVDHLHAAPVFYEYLKPKLAGANLVAVSPDSGSVKMAQAYGNMFDAGFAVVAKRRVDANSVESSHLVGEVRDRVCLLTDDLTTTAGTLTAAAALLKKNGAGKIIAAVSHCLLTATGRERLRQSQIDELVTSDAVPVADLCDGRISVVSIAPLMGEAIRRIHQGDTVSSLFSSKK